MFWKNKTVLITGVAGFIGQNLAKFLIPKGTKIYGVDNLSFGRPQNVPRGIEFMTLDVRSEYFKKSFENKRLDFIFHFGAPCTVRQFETDPIKSIHNTVLGFASVLDIASLTDIRVIYPSSGNVYGTTENNEEFTKPHPTNLYAMSKLICEKMAMLDRTSKSTGLRIFAGYGPGEEHKGDYASVVTIFLNQMRNDKSPVIWGDGSQTRDFIYIDDIINGILAAAEKKPMMPILNLGTGKSTSFNRLIEILNELLEKDIEPKYVPKPESYVQETKANTVMMRKCLGVNPVPLRAGIIKYLKRLNLYR